MTQYERVESLIKESDAAIEVAQAAYTAAQTAVKKLSARDLEGFGYIYLPIRNNWNLKELKDKHYEH